MSRWRFLDTGIRSAEENIALDDVILECCAKNVVPNTLRFLQFSPSAVLVGHHQSVEQEVRLKFCEEMGINVNRRLTGGGAIFFDENSLGWEIIASKKELSMNYPTVKLFKRMCEGPILGLRALGVKASFRPKNDIEVKNRKISGTGGTERDNAFLFQGTLLIDFDVDTMIRSLRIPVMKLKDKEIASVKQRVTSINQELNYIPSLEIIKNVLRQGFEKALNIELENGKLTSFEKKLLAERLINFRSKKWIFSDRKSSNSALEACAIRKTRGGLIRVSLVLDKEDKFIRSSLITGDFFIFPSNAVLKLEAVLKGVSYSESEISKVIKSFFHNNQINIPGVSPDDFIKLIIEAINKTNFESLGINLKEANHIHAVNGDALKILNGNCEVLLLPYCAKLPKCQYRKKEGCIKCGECSVGEAYDFAEKASLLPITIQSFDHLMSTLNELKQSGVKGYIGCCCEGFYCKHQEDFEKVNVPGVLLDIDDKTCYDLGKENEALNGNFESQTHLKFDVLLKLLDTNILYNKFEKAKTRK
jgi:lipoate-protein ligase A